MSDILDNDTLSGQLAIDGKAFRRQPVGDPLCRKQPQEPGDVLEGTLRNERRLPSGRLDHTVIYGKLPPHSQEKEA